MEANVFPTPKLKMPALLFVFSLIGFVLLMVVVIGLVLPSFPNGIGELTPQQMSSFLGKYVLIQAFPLVPILLGVAGIALLYPSLKETAGRRFAWLALLVAVLMGILYFVLILFRISLTSFSDATLSANPVWQWTSWAYDKLGLILPALATCFIAISLYQSSLLRRTGLVIAILSGILIPLALFVGYPPFVFGFLWLAIGIGLLGRK
jgi:hypothetical protein